MGRGQGEVDFEKRLYEKYAGYFDTAEELIAMARDMAENRPMVFHSTFDGLAAFFFAKSYKTFAAICVLARRGFGEDAAVLSRGLLENATNLLYISQDPEARAALYVEHEYVARNKYITMLESIGELDLSGPQRATAREQLRRLYESVKDNYPIENLWSGKSLRRMAQEVGLSMHYAYAYRYFSDIAHGGPSTISQIMEPGEQQGFVGIMFGPDETLVSDALVWGSDLFWRALAKHNEIFSLDFDDRLREAALRLRQTFKSPSEPGPG